MARFQLETFTTYVSLAAGGVHALVLRRKVGIQVEWRFVGKNPIRYQVIAHVQKAAAKTDSALFIRFSAPLRDWNFVDFGLLQTFQPTIFRDALDGPARNAGTTSHFSRGQMCAGYARRAFEQCLHAAHVLFRPDGSGAAASLLSLDAASLSADLSARVVDRL